MLRRHPRAPLAALLLIATATHFLYFAVNEDVVSEDSHTYLAPARSLADGEGFLNKYGQPETRRTPGYPLFLAPLVRSVDAIRVVQHLLSIVLIYGIYRFVLWVTRRGDVAFLAGLLVAVDQPSIHHADAILTETLFTPFVFGCAVLLYAACHPERERGNWWRGWRAAAAAGLVGGMAVLVRPIGIYFFAAGAVYLVLAAKARRFALIAVFIATFLLAPLAWSARNHAKAGQFTISTITSWSILCDRAAATLAIGEAGDFRTHFFRWRRELVARAGDPPAAINPNYVPRPGETLHPERYSAIAMEVLRTHPLDYARVWLRALLWTLLGGGATPLHAITGLPLGVLRAAVLVYNAAVTALAAFGLFVLWRMNRRVAWLLMLTVAYYLVTCSVGEPSSRFRVPIAPFLTIAAAAGAVRLARWREWRTEPPPAAVAVPPPDARRAPP